MAKAEIGEHVYLIIDKAEGRGGEGGKILVCISEEGGDPQR